MCLEVISSQQTVVDIKKDIETGRPAVMAANNYSKRFARKTKSQLVLTSPAPNLCPPLPLRVKRKSSSSPSPRPKKRKKKKSGRRRSR